MSDAPGPVFNPGGGDDNLRIPLDMIGEDGPLGQYPPGLSFMRVSAEANWNEMAAACLVFSICDPDFGLQFLIADWGGKYERYWEGAAWSGWQEFSPMFHVHAGFQFSAIQARTEATAIEGFDEGTTRSPVAGAGNWGPNSSEAGILETTRHESEGTQTFHAYNNNQYRRAYTAGAWSSWVAT